MCIMTTSMHLAIRFAPVLPVYSFLSIHSLFVQTLKFSNNATRAANYRGRLQPAWCSKCRDFLCCHSTYFSPKESKSATRMHDLIKRHIEDKQSHNSILELAVLVIARKSQPGRPFNDAIDLYHLTSFTTMPNPFRNLAIGLRFPATIEVMQSTSVMQSDLYPSTNFTKNAKLFPDAGMRCMIFPSNSGYTEPFQ